MDTITVSDLVDALYKKFDGKFTKKDLNAIMDELVAQISGALEEGKNVKIKNLGIFHIVTRAARKVIPPGKKQPIEVPPKKTVKFKLSAKLASELSS